MLFLELKIDYQPLNLFLAVHKLLVDRSEASFHYFLLLLGTLYCFGNMNTYMTSYLRTHVAGQEHRLYSDAIWIPTLATLGQGTFMTFAGHLEERIGVRATILLGE